MPVIWGLHPAREALRAGRVIRLLVLKDGENARLKEVMDMAKERAVEVRFEDRRRLDAMSGGASHQGVAAVLPDAAWRDQGDLLDRPWTEPPLFLVLDGVEDPRNMGAILRCADGAGVSGVFLPKRRSAPISETVWKTSAGAAGHVPLSRVSNIAQTLDLLKKRGVWVVGADAGGGMAWHEADFTCPTAIVLGGEGAGLHRLVREHCDFLVRLPMLGSVQSLNVSVTAGVLLYEALRQRAAAGKRDGRTAR